MQLRTGLIVGTLLLAVSLFAQTTDGDPVSGDWGSDSTRVLQLKFDGTQTVTGTVFLVINGRQRSSAGIKVGSYDLRSRSLKLEGEIAGPDGGELMPYVIEGVLENDALDVGYKFGNDAGRAILRK